MAQQLGRRVRPRLATAPPAISAADHALARSLDLVLTPSAECTYGAAFEPGMLDIL